MKTILITGANGQLGSEIKRFSPDSHGNRFIFTDLNELNITSPPELYSFSQDHNIDFIVNCAAYTAVDKAETDKKNARLLNSEGAKNLADIASKNKIKLIHISTDYVFDGNHYVPYKETDVTNPQSVYGITKLQGELEIQSSPAKAIIIRTSWLYSSFGNNFVKTMLRLGKERNELNVVYDQIGTPTYAADLAKTIIGMINSNKFIPGIYHYSNEGVCSWYDFAIEIMELANLRCNINPIETKDYPTPTKRPMYSLLNKEKIKSVYNISIPHWKSSLKNCFYLFD